MLCPYFCVKNQYATMKKFCTSWYTALMTYDILAIGDITIDDFIELNPHEARVDRDEAGGERLSMAFGEKVPYLRSVIVPAVGNAPNAAVAAARLGLHSALASNIGVDRRGKDCLETLRREGVHTPFVTQHEHKVTNYHYVLRYGAERTILIKHETYPYRMPALPQVPRAIYFSSVGEDALHFHHEIAAYCAQHKDVKLTFQPGTFQLRLFFESLPYLYATTNLFVCNVEEAQQLLDTAEKDVPALMRAIAKHGPRTVCITDGTRGAYALDEENAAWFCPAYPDPKPPLDRTGAGDSFASTVTAMRLHGLPLHEALRYGPINSMSVVQYIGAQEGLLTRETLEAFLKNAPETYQVQRIG